MQYLHSLSLSFFIQELNFNWITIFSNSISKKIYLVEISKVLKIQTHFQDVSLEKEKQGIRVGSTLPTFPHLSPIIKTGEDREQDPRCCSPDKRKPLKSIVTRLTNSERNTGYSQVGGFPRGTSKDAGRKYANLYSYPETRFLILLDWLPGLLTCTNHHHHQPSLSLSFSLSLSSHYHTWP